MIALTCSIKKAFFIKCIPLFMVHKSLRSLAYVGTCLIMSRSGILTFTCFKTSKISRALFTTFLDWRAMGKGEAKSISLFILVSLFSSFFSLSKLSAFVLLLFSSSSFFSFFYFGFGIGWSTCLPALKVMVVLTSSSLVEFSLVSSISWTPLGFCWGYEDNFPFSYTICMLVSLEIASCILSIFYVRLVCKLSNFWLKDVFTWSIIWFNWDEVTHHFT